MRISKLIKSRINKILYLHECLAAPCVCKDKHFSQKSFKSRLSLFKLAILQNHIFLKLFKFLDFGHNVLIFFLSLPQCVDLLLLLC